MFSIIVCGKRVEYLMGKQQTLAEYFGDISPSDVAHTVIDVQRGICEPGFWAPEDGTVGTEFTQSIASHIGGIMPSFRAAAARTMIIYYAFQGAGFETALGGPYRIERQDGDLVVPKTQDAAFESSDVDSVLTDHGIGGIFVSGFNANACVPYFAEEAVRRGYKVAFLEDAIGQRGAAGDIFARQSMDSMERRGLFRTSSAEALSFLNGLQAV